MSREATMGMLLRFNAKTPRSVPVTQLAEDDQAKILLFTGVRYEREEEGSRAKTTRTRQTARKGRTKQ